MNKNLNLLISSHTGNFLGGAEKSLLLFLKHTSIPANNIRVVIPHIGWKGCLKSRIEEEGLLTSFIQKHSDKTPFEKYIISPKKLLLRLFGNIRFILNYYKLIRYFKPDIIYLNTIFCLIDGIIGFLSGIPVFLHIRGIEEKDFKGVRRFRILMYGLITKKIITVDSQSKRRIENFGRIFKDKIVYIPNGIPTNETVDELIIEKYKTIYKKGNIKILGCLGRVCNGKNTEYFAQLAERVTREYDDVNFIWVGDYSSTEESQAVYDSIVEKHTDLIQNGRLLFTGYQNDPLNWLAIFDVMLFVSKKEGMPRTLLEAMAMKKTIVSFAIDGVNDLIKDKEDGFLIPPFDYDAFERRVFELLKEDLSEDMAESAHKKMMKNFTQEKITEKIDNTLTGISKIL